MKSKRALTLVFVFAVSGISMGEQFAFVGARAASMGGANAASVTDATLQWHNPAVLGFMNKSKNEDAAETNAVSDVVTDTEVLAAANALLAVAAASNEVVDVAAETNVVTEAEDTAIATNAVPVDSVATNLAEDVATPTNAATDEVIASTNAVPPEVETTNAVFSTAQLDSPEGVLGPEVLEEPAEVDEEGYNLLDNNGLADRTFGWNLLDVGFGYTMTEDMGRYLDILADVDFANIDQVNTPEQVSDLVAMAAALKGVSDPGNSFYVDANAGTSVRMGHFAVGVRLFGEAAMWVDELDSNNLGLAADVATLNSDLDSIVSSEGFVFSGTLQALSSSQLAALTGPGELSLTNAYYLDAQLGQLLADGTIKQSDIDGASELLEEVVAATASGGDLGNNTTAVAARGFALAEIPISYGRAVNDHLSWGVTAKAMYGRVLGTRIWVFDEDNLDEAVQSVSDTESDTLTFGLDLGALYRIENFQFAAVAHNINRPTFDGYDDSLVVNGSNVVFNVPDVKIDPQMTLGAAYIPSKRFMLEVNYDLLETGTLLNGYDIQRLSVGSELNLWALLLRLGAYNNLAESSQDWVATAGVGLNVFGARVDIGGAYSLGENAEIDGQEIPSEARLGVSIGMDF